MFSVNIGHQRDDVITLDVFHFASDTRGDLKGPLKTLTLKMASEETEKKIGHVYFFF